MKREAKAAAAQDELEQARRRRKHELELVVQRELDRGQLTESEAAFVLAALGGRKGAHPWG